MNKTVGEVIDDYERYQRFEKGNKRASAYVTSRRLAAFFENRDLPMRLVDAALCQARYDDLAGKVQVATHRNTLAQVKTFLRWCAEKGFVSGSPAESGKPKGRPTHGKAQLRVDEARRWLAKAVEYAEAGEAGSVAAMMALLMGMRASEIVERVVRDVDDGGSLLWITASKTAAGRRRLTVPELLQPLLAAIADVVTAHGLRGTHATLATEAGMSGRAVANALGHSSPTTTY